MCNYQYRNQHLGTHIKELTFVFLDTNTELLCIEFCHPPNILDIEKPPSNKHRHNIWQEQFYLFHSLCWLNNLVLL